VIDGTDFLIKKIDFYIGELNRVEPIARRLGEICSKNESSLEIKDGLVIYQRILDIHERITTLIWDIIAKTSLLFNPDEKLFLDIYNSLSDTEKRDVLRVMSEYAKKKIYNQQ